MNFTLTEDQQEPGRAAAAFLDKCSAEPELRRLTEADCAPDPAVWSQMAPQVVLQGLLIRKQSGREAELCVKRAKTCELLFGDPAVQRERLAELGGI